MMLCWMIGMRELDLSDENTIETVENLIKNNSKVSGKIDQDIIIFGLKNTYNEVPYPPFGIFGYFQNDEIKAIMVTLNSERVIISLQLENDWMREKEVYRTGLFSIADKETDEAFWYKILKKALNMCPDYLSLRFAQVTGVKLRGMVVKKRVPLGMGYPNVDVLTKTLAKFIIKEIHEEDLSTEIHLIYTGLPENKYVDCVKLYSMLANELVPYLQ